ncbi:Nop14-like protein [Abeliophyllum distichum]|uniref:Nop14-like protein n=1 Tax=Abeliophyllum distichum TaxID=126358 RepID=A0ABD1VZN3_9LAMI
MAKKSKPTSNGSAMSKKNKNKMKNKLSVPNSVAMKNKAPKPNPFESIWSRRKFDILGKKRKGEERRVGLSRSVAIEKRKKTLLKEYEQSGKSSAFVDKRIGEQNEDLAEFDKAILRSQRERQLKLKKKSIYNLSDGEEDEFDIQGLGSLLERDDFEDEVPFDEDEDGEAAGNEKKSTILGQLYPQGTENDLEARLMAQENRHKSKKEVMEEIISKSKFFKAQKAKDKEENEQFIEQLDKDFASMVQSEALLSLTQPNKMKALKALVNKNISIDHAEKEGISASQDKFSVQQEKPDSYDKLVGEMAMDMRARPSDRTKKPEEVAQEEKERLERLEEERQKRIVAGDDSSDDDTDASEDKEVYTKELRSISGDDLGDSFTHDAETRTKLALIAEICRREDENDLESDDDDASEDSEDDDNHDEDEGSDEDDDNYEETQSLKDWEQSDDDNVDHNLEDEGGEDEEEKDNDIDIRVETTNDKKSSGSKAKEKDSLDRGKVKANIKKDLLEHGELPYTIEAPKTYEEFSALLENCSDDQIVEAIRRIRTFNAISVAAENRKKMQVFYGVLLQYFAVLANRKPLNIKLLNLLIKPLMEMSSEIPYFAAICARQRLLHTRTKFCEDAKITGKSSWPSLKTLFLLRLWSLIFPCSDFRHVVMTPAILLTCEYLMRCPIMTGRDIAIGSFLCSMVLSISRQSQKFCPEAIMFIQTLLMVAFDKKQGSSEDSKLYRLMEIKALKPLLCLQGQVEKINSLDFLMLMDLPDDSPYFTSDVFRASVLFATIETLKGFVNIYEGFKSFPEIFLPISKLLGELSKQDHIPDALQVQIKDVTQLIEKKAQEFHLLRQPLRMRKPKIIKTEIPKFEENFVKGRDYDPDRERAQRKKLKKLLGQEAKGAARELRKDNYFLLEVKERDRQEEEEMKSMFCSSWHTSGPAHHSLRASKQAS